MLYTSISCLLRIAQRNIQFLLLLSFPLLKISVVLNDSGENKCVLWLTLRCRLGGSGDRSLNEQLIGHELKCVRAASGRRALCALCYSDGSTFYERARGNFACANFECIVTRLSPARPRLCLRLGFLCCCYLRSACVRIIVVRACEKWENSGPPHSLTPVIFNFHSLFYQSARLRSAVRITRTV